MLDIRQIRSEPEKVQKALARRGKDISLEPILQADARRRALLVEAEALKAKLNASSAEIGKKKKAGEEAPAALLEEMRQLGDNIHTLEIQIREVDAELDTLLLKIPNLPDDAIPEGLTEEENVIVREWGTPRKFDFEPLPHWEIGARLGILDFTKAAKISGTKFEVFIGAGERLRRALIQFMLDSHRQEGYTEVGLPLMALRNSLIASGHLPAFEEDQFAIKQEDMFLIPTAEAALVNLHRDDILSEDQLPLNYVAHTPCFRYEKVGAGKESRGLIRQYQFDKVEMFKFCTPETSFDELEKLVANAEAVYKALELPYRLALLCAGEIGSASTKTYDPMAWFPGMGKWMELSSCSNCLDWQARRANVRFRRGIKNIPLISPSTTLIAGTLDKPEVKGTVRKQHLTWPSTGLGSKDKYDSAQPVRRKRLFWGSVSHGEKGKPEFVHTLNGSGLAVGRTFAALLENHQQADGSVVIPSALRQYMNGMERIDK